MSHLSKALFIDLDNTLIRTKSGETFPKDYDDWELIPGIKDRIASYHKAGYTVLIVSNQGGIEAGFVNEVLFKAKVEKVITELTFNIIKKDWYKKGTPVKIDMYYSKSVESSNYDRKPNPGMAYKLACMQKLDLAESIMVGDASGNIKILGKNIKDHGEGWVVDITGRKSDVIAEKSKNGVIEGIFADAWSNTDALFAKNAGIGEYYDILEFIETE